MGDIKGKKILVVDDDPVMLQLVQQIFFREGGQVYTATNGLEGLDQFHTHQPDLVVLDIMMPVMDGWEACHRIRQSSPVPIIMLSAWGKRGDALPEWKDEADDYVTKPFTTDFLVARAKAALR